MKIRVADISTEELCKEEELSPDFVGKLTLEGAQLTGPVAVRARVVLSGDTAVVKLDVQASLEAPCSRCLEPMTLNIKKRDYTFSVIVKQNQKTIDLTDRVKEAIIINLPIKPLCKEDCKGLCPHCGVNLNSVECQCKVAKNGKNGFVAPFSQLDHQLEQRDSSIDV